MKQFLLFCFTVITFSTIGQTSVDNPNSRWYVAKTYADGDINNPGFSSTKTTVYGIKGDTIINSKKWMKIYATEDSLFQNNLEYRGLLITVGQKVLYMDTLYQLDTLYDFSLNVGDSVLFKLNNNTLPTWVKVDETDSVQLNDGAYYKRIKFEEPQIITAFTLLNGIWIEGVGSIHGPLFTNSPRMFSSEIPDSLILTCSYSDNQHIWQHPSYQNCFIQNILNIDEIEAVDFKVYPNPFSDEIHLKNPGWNKVNLTITNNIGKVVHEFEINNAQATIDLSTINAGFYLLKIKNKSHTSILKIIKER